MTIAMSHRDGRPLRFHTEIMAIIVPFIEMINLQLVLISHLTDRIYLSACYTLCICNRQSLHCSLQPTTTVVSIKTWITEDISPHEEGVEKNPKLTNQCVESHVSLLRCYFGVTV